MAEKNNWTSIGEGLHKAAMLSAALLASGLFTAPAAYAGTVREILASENSILVKFDDVVNKASVFTLAGPDRIAIDILGATKGNAATVGGPVSNVRQGQFTRDTARIVFDLATPALVTGGYFSADGRSLTINLRRAVFSEFSNALGRGRISFVPPALFRSKPPKKRYEVSAPIGRASKRGMPKIYGPSDPTLPLVVIDAGHGGHDPGSISPHGGKREKDVTLAIAKSIRDELVKTGRIRVALTRENDRFLVLEDRFGIARKMQADLFMSIHADAAGNAQANGATVYTLSEVASDREAQKLAARENKADIINGINLGGADANVSSILIDLTQRETMNVSADFAKLLIREAKPNMRLRSNSHRFASFVVLKAPDTPSVLFETGYLTNAKDVEFLASKAGQRRVGRSVASAIQVHFARRLASR
ncbi:MAG: N-acetylmuramoyl-L-alanine amidase [Sphingorhabdus sp.]